MVVRVSVVLRIGLLVTVIGVSTNCAEVIISVEVKSVSLVDGVGILFFALLVNRPFPPSHSRGTKPPCWRAKVALGQDKQRKLPFKIMYVFCLSCPSATFALQRSGFVPREWLAAKGLLSREAIGSLLVKL